MSAFKDIIVEDGYARVGAGNIWGEVYSAVEKYNVTVAGGRVFSVGVPGFTLGGVFGVSGSRGSVVEANKLNRRIDVFDCRARVCLR